MAKTVIERAFEIARSGQFRRMDYLRKQLEKEGYDAGPLLGRSLSKQIHALDREARARDRSMRSMNGAESAIQQDS